MSIWVTLRVSQSGSTRLRNQCAYAMKLSSGRGSAGVVPVSRSQWSTVSWRCGSAMLDARRLERSSMPVGMFRSQKDMGSPNDDRLDAGGSQMGRCGEPVRARADDGHVALALPASGLLQPRRFLPARILEGR